MKIGFVIYGSLDTLSGGYLYDRKLVEYLRTQGDTVEIIPLPWRNYAAHLTDNFWFRFWSPGACSWKFRQQAVELQNLRLQKFDILIQDELNHPSLIAANAGTHPCPIISLVHHLRCSELRPKWQNIFYRIVEKKYLQSVDGFIFNSQTTKSVVHGLMVNEKPSIVAYPPTDRFGKMVSEEEIKARATREPFRILFLGNVIYRKGLHILLNALAGVEYRLDVAGSLDSEPKYAQEIQRQASALGLRSSATFHGALDNEALIEKFGQAHVLVVPSSYEGFGIVYLEGMGFGLPAIGTTAGAASEIIVDGETGWLIAPDDSQTLAARLASLANDREALVRMSIHALKRYQEQPKWEQTARQIRMFLYEQRS